MENLTGKQISGSIGGEVSISKAISAFVDSVSTNANGYKGSVFELMEKLARKADNFDTIFWCGYCFAGRDGGCF